MKYTRTIFLIVNDEFKESYYKTLTRKFYYEKSIIRNPMASCATFYDEKTMGCFSTMHDNGSEIVLEKIKKEFGFVFVVNQNLQPAKIKVAINPEKNSDYKEADWWEEVLEIHNDLMKELSFWKVLKNSSKLVEKKTKKIRQMSKGVENFGTKTRRKILEF